MTDDQLLRYSRHIMLDEIGIEGQERILAAHAVIIGAGGLGSPAALYLGAAGVGQITVIDDDTVDLTNLQRQIAHTTERVGSPKVESLRAAVHAINPSVRITALQQRADDTLLDQLLPTASIVLDCCDNYRTRHLVNAACVRHKKPLVAAAALRFDGQLMVINPEDAQAPCYACVFAPEAEFAEEQCATMGVFAPLVGTMGSLQAAEALKLIAGFGQAATGKLMMFDSRRMDWSSMRVQKNGSCPVCSKGM